MSTKLIAAAANSPIMLKSESRGKKKKHASPRSAFYSLLMKSLAGERGDDLAEALTNKDMDKFRDLMGELADDVAETAAKQDFDFKD